VSGTRLDPIVADVRRRAADRRRARPLERLRASVRPDESRRARFVSAFRKDELGVIAEMKRRSPSAGSIGASGPAYASLARAYREGGANAISVLTEQDHFGGSLDDLAAVAFTELPRLRKDFLVDEGMLLESAHHGADAVLLLAAILEPRILRDLRARARDLGFAVLLEVHDERELDLALPLEPELLGVNARDLRTFEVDLATVERLLPLVPHGDDGPIRVAESGLRTLADVRRVRDAGADAVLVGEALVRDASPAATLRAWKEAFRG
jgi:indole-3-glycerol phosphate synthase